MENSVTRRSVCGVCSARCVVDVTTENGRVVKVSRPTEPEFADCCRLCVRGVNSPDYVNHADRVIAPLRRVGEKGAGKFEEITWDEALGEIAEKLLGYKRSFGADSVAFYTGFTKWYRPYLQRLAYSFGTVNYGTESSTCFRSTTVAQQADTGFVSGPDVKNAGVLLAVAAGNLSPLVKSRVREGMKLVAVDCRGTKDLEKYATVLLRPVPGTDAALAHGLARIFIHSGAADLDYIQQHVHGFEEYSHMVEAFTPAYVQSLTGVDACDLEKAAEIIMDNGPFALQNGFTGLIHHRNGMQTYRAFEALCAVLGTYGRPGGNLPQCVLDISGHSTCSLRKFEFSHETMPSTRLKVGGEKYPLWSAVTDEMQAVELPRQILTARPYPIKAVFALGLNARIFPDSAQTFRALEQLEFFAVADLFLTETAKYADIVLPAAASYERDQLALVAGDSKLLYVEPAAKPAGQAISDEDIICRLAKLLTPEDDLLCAGKEACREFMLSGAGLTVAQVREMKTPFVLPHEEPPRPLESGFATPTGKFELRSELIAAYSAAGLRPLPEYEDVLGPEDESYPLILMAGVRGTRYVHTFHSRTHRVESLRKIRPAAAADLNPEDAKRLGIEKGDDIILSTAFGKISVKADMDSELLPGTVNMYQDYPEADVNTLIPSDYTDLYTGFPGYKAIRCRVEKK